MNGSKWRSWCRRKLTLALFCCYVRRMSAAWVSLRRDHVPRHHKLSNNQVSQQTAESFLKASRDSATLVAAKATYECLRRPAQRRGRALLRLADGKLRSGRTTRRGLDSGTRSPMVVKSLKKLWRRCKCLAEVMVKVEDVVTDIKDRK